MGKPAFDRGKIYDSTVSKETRPIIEPYTDEWLDPAILVGPPPIIWPVTDPPILKNPYPLSPGGGGAGDPVVTARPSQYSNLQKFSVDIPKETNRYQGKLIREATSVSGINKYSTSGKIDGESNGITLINTIGTATTAMSHDIKYGDVKGVKAIVASAEEKLKDLLIKYGVLTASAAGEIEIMNELLDLMNKHSIEQVLDEVASNVFDAAHNVSIPDITDDVDKWVDNMDQFPEWMSRAMLSIPDEYSIGDDVGGLINNILPVADTVGNTPTASNGMSQLQTTAALAT